MPFYRFLSVALMVFLPLNQAMAQPGPDKETLGKTAIAAYGANIRSFTFYRCRFRCTKGQAKSVADAIAGRLQNTISYEVRMAVDGEKDAYESLAPPMQFDRKHVIHIPGNNRFVAVPAPADTSRYLADGAGHELGFLPEMRAANLWSREYAVRGITAPTPLDMFFVGHRSSYGPDVEEANPDYYEASYDGTKEIDGHPTIGVRFKNKENASVRSYTFDVEHGYLPIRMTGSFPKRPDKTRVFVTDVRECSGQRWFPERTVDADAPDNPRDLYDVRIIQVLDLDVDHRPGADDLAIHLPAGTAVSEAKVAKAGDAPKVFRLKQDELVHPDDLPAMIGMVNQAPRMPLMDTAIPHRRRWVRWAGIAGGALLATGGVLWFLWRRRAARA